jgi:hypothetical protein
MTQNGKTLSMHNEAIWKGTFTDKTQLGPEKSEVSPDLDKFIKRYVKESLKNKY